MGSKMQRLLFLIKFYYFPQSRLYRALKYSKCWDRSSRRPQVWEPQMLVVCVWTSGTSERRRREFLGSVWVCSSTQKFLKIRASKMAILYILRRIPCLSEELTRLFFGWNTLFTLESILFTICVDSFKYWLILSKVQSLNTNAGFYSVVVGQRV